MSMGAGHDFSIGLLVDAAGNDRYDAGGLSMGAANANGWGLLLDLEGDDEYGTTANSANEACGISRGLETGTIREDMLNLGMFLDLGGRDAYEGQPDRPLRDNARIVQPRRFPSLNLKSECGVFLDGEYTTGVLRLGPWTE